jgi:hypothetical protein
VIERTWLNWRDLVATALVAVIVAVFAGRGGAPFEGDVRLVAAVGLVLGMAAVLVVGQAAVEPQPWHRTALLGGEVAFALGVGACVLSSGVVLAMFVAAVVLTWGAGLLAHARERHGGRRTGRGFWHG